MKQAIREATAVILPLISVGELRAGFLAGGHGPRNEAVMERFMMQPRVQVIAPDEATTHHYARLFVQLRRQGTPIPTNDLWIAALVLQHHLTLYSDDAHFRHVPQLPIY